MMANQPALPNCRATGIGSTPHTDAASAVDFILETFPDVPCWPQLPRRSLRENMYVQFTEHLPGVRIDDERQRIHVELGESWFGEAEAFYAAFLEEDPERFALSPDYAAGLDEFLRRLLRRGPPAGAWAVKGQVTGPISFGLQVTDQHLRPSLYDDAMRDVIVKNVLRQAQWQEARLYGLAPRTIISIDEPFLSVIGSSFASLSEAGVVAALEEVFSGLTCCTCTHCCGNTDWSLLLRTSVDILAFDAYGYAERMALYPDELRSYLARGGMLAWGMLPNTLAEAQTITQDGAWQAFEHALSLFERKGFDRRALLERSFITPACGTGPLDVVSAERVMRLTRALSDQVREEYGLR